jgi:hypothetical protein
MLLLFYGAVLAWQLRGAALSQAQSLPANLLDDPPTLRSLGRIALQWGIGQGARAASFLPLGLLCALLVPRSPLRHLPVRLLFLLLCLVPAGLLTTWEQRLLSPAPLPLPLALVVPLGGALLGAYVGLHWARRRWRGLGIAGLKLLALALALGGTGAVLLRYALDEAPVPAPVPLTSADRQRLWAAFRGASPEGLGPGEVRALRLSARDLSQLLSWGASLTDDGAEPRARALVEIGEDDVMTLRADLRLPLRLRRRYLHVIVRGRPAVAGGQLSFTPVAVRVGRLDIPGWLAGVTSAAATSVFSRSPKVARILPAIERLGCEGGALQVSYRRATLAPGFLADLFRGAGASQQVLVSVLEQARHLIDAASFLMREGKLPTLSDVMTTAFVLAQVRSAQGDPVLENMAAILALGMFVGHPRVAGLVGPVPQMGEVLLGEKRRLLLQVQARGRRDLAQHFFVSASLTLVSSRAVSGAAGLLKEELDMRRGESGFSFADLAMDRAGTLFAVAATRDEASARAVQARIRAGFQVGDFFPEVSGLPEGLSQEALAARYGGVGGAGYRQVLAEIEARLRRCPGLLGEKGAPRAGGP